MRNWRKYGALLVLFALVFATGCGGLASKKIPVQVATARLDTVKVAVSLSGVLAPNKTANVFTKLSGVVERVTADVGDEVAAGQLLLELDTRELEAQLKQAEAAIALARAQAEDAKVGITGAQAELDLAQKTYARVKKLQEAGAASQSQLDEAEAKLKGAKAKYDDLVKKYEAAQKSVAVQEAQAGVIRAQLSNSRITSPLSGTVTNRNINPGELAAPGVALLTIADLHLLKFQGMVSQEVVPLLRVGQKVEVTVDALPGKVFSGKIARIGPVASSTGQYFPLEIAVAAGQDLRAGMTARATLELTGPQGVVVPRTAVKKEKEAAYVFVVRGEKVYQRKVRLGLEGRNGVLVLAGLQPGEKVAVSNVSLLRHGMLVSPSRHR